MKLLLMISGFLFFLGQDCKNSKHSVQNNLVGADSTVLDGNWVLNYISAPASNFDSLYHDRKPWISFNIASNKFAGNTGCNNFNGPLKLNGSNISFKDPFAMTRMACPGDGEKVFLETLNKVDKYSVTDKNTLNLVSGDVAVMMFTRK